MEKLMSRINQNMPNAMRYGLWVVILYLVPQWALAETLAEMLQAVRSTAVSHPETAAGGASNSTVQLPSDADLALAEKLFRRVFAGESGPELRQQWASLGFELTGTRSESDPMLVLQEFGEGSTQSRFSGKGFFVFAVGRDSKTVLQAPHSFSDAGTRAIALELMANYNFRAAAWNTSPARLPVHSALPADLQPAPVKDYMLAFTKALMIIAADSRVVQLHSFEKKDMYTVNGSHADIILSGYGERPNQAIGWLGRCLKEKLDYKTRTFPFEVQEMGAGRKLSGATENVVGAVMQEHGSQGFVHLGMSSEFSKELRSYPQVQKKLYACLSRE
jgi:hypothetical protein